MRQTWKVGGPIALVVFSTASAVAAESPEACTRNAVRFDVCAQAEKLKAEFPVEQAGKRLGRGVYQRLDVDGPALAYAVTWTLNANEIAKQADASGQAGEPLRQQLSKLATDTVCKDPQAAAMTRLGAAYSYRFLLPDGRTLADFPVRECPAP